MQYPLHKSGSKFCYNSAIRICHVGESNCEQYSHLQYPKQCNCVLYFCRTLQKRSTGKCTVSWGSQRISPSNMRTTGISKQTSRIQQTCIQYKNGGCSGYTVGFNGLVCLKIHSPETLSSNTSDKVAPSVLFVGL